MVKRSRAVAVLHISTAPGRRKAQKNSPKNDCLLWVISGHHSADRRCPLHPLERTCSASSIDVRYVPTADLADGVAAIVPRPPGPISGPMRGIDKEAEITGKVLSNVPTHGELGRGFVFESYFSDKLPCIRRLCDMDSRTMGTCMRQRWQHP